MTLILLSSLKEGEYVPPLGEYLGQLTNELTCKGFGCKHKIAQVTGLKNLSVVVLKIIPLG